MSGVAMQRSKSISPPLNRFGQIFGTNNIGTGGRGFIGLGVPREHRNAHRLAGAMGSYTTPRTIWSA